MPRITILLCLFVALFTSRAQCQSSGPPSFSLFLELLEGFLEENPVLEATFFADVEALEYALVPASVIASLPLPQLDPSLTSDLTLGELQVLYFLYEGYFGGASSSSSPGLEGFEAELEQALALIAQSFENTLVPQPAATLPSLSYLLDNAPAAIRLALIPNGMVVSWQTALSYSTAPVVLFGIDKEFLFLPATGVSHSYGTAQFHDVLLHNLLPSTRYYYRIVQHPALFTSYLFSSKIYNFTTAPHRGASKPFVATVIGDMGTINAGDTYEHVLSLVPHTDLVLHIGDLSYADDFFLRPEAVGDNTYETSWNSWQFWLQPITSAVPYMVLPGNHEASCQEVISHTVCPPQQQNFTAYRNRFRMPSRESGAGNVQGMWSSFDYGLVHFVNIDTSTDFPGAPDGPNTILGGGPFGGAGTGNPSLLDWLEQDLHKANQSRHAVPWIIVSGHRPIYSSDLTDGEPAVKAAFEGLLNKYKVDFYFAGHLHNYERLYPIALGGEAKVYSSNVYTNPNAPTYIVNGAAGNDEGHSLGVRNVTISAYLDDAHYGYGRLSVFNATAIHWQYFHADDGSLGDDMWLIKTTRV